MSCAHSDDGAGDGVSGAHRYSGQGCGEESNCTGGFGAESADRFQLGDAGAHRVDDAPSAEVSTEGYSSVCGQDDGPVKVSPGGLELSGRDEVSAEEGAGNDPHGFLGVIAAMAQAIGRGGEELELAKPGIDTLRRLVA